jgi:hypothetical protein
MDRGRPIRGTLTLSACAVACLALGAAPAAAHGKKEKDVGFQTDRPAMLRALEPGGKVQPIINVGERLENGYTFESIPDGIALQSGRHGRVEAFVNHETSTVPFPLATVPGEPGQTDPSRTFADKTNSIVSRLELASHHRHGVGVTDGSYAIPSEANYQRFCSNFLASREHGFKRPLLFTNEEATDFVFRTGQAWRGPGVTGPGAEQAGVVVALDPRTGEYRTIYGMGRHNHENSVAVPGYGKPVVLSGDDTFSAPSSQMYLYTARNSDDVWEDRGTLWAFRSDVAAVNDYGDLSAPGAAVSGRFIEVPRDIAVGDQTGLENWSNANNVFQFIRVEDIAYDRRLPWIVYFADTGEPRALPDPATGRLRRGPSGTQGPYPNGRIFRMILAPWDPTRVLRLDVVYDGDAGGYNNPGVIHQPDNLETTRHSVLITEDPGSHQQFAGATNARVWQLDPWRRTARPVAEVDQSEDPAAPPGAWEASGIVDASRWLGRDTFLIDVEAHSILLDQQQEDVYGDSRLDVTTKREDGQLLTLKLPGA